MSEIVVVGSSGTIGKALVQALESRGHKIIKLDLLNIDNIECNEFHIDITDELSIKKNIDYLRDNYKQIDAIVNVCYPKGQNYGARLNEVTLNTFNANVSLHLGGYFALMKCVSERFHDTNLSYINFSSIYGVVAPKFEIYEGTNMTMPVEYAAIKSAIIHLTKYFSKFYRKSQIRFNCISPGGVFDHQDANFVDAYSEHAGPYGMMEPIDLVSSVEFLVSHGSRFVTGQNLVIDDGFTL